MTEEKAIKTIESAKHFTYDDVYMEAFDTAIDIIRKYQKIQAYMKKLERNGQYGTLRKLKMVIGEEYDV